MSFNFDSASRRFARSTCVAFSCSRNNSYVLTSVNPSLVNFCSMAVLDNPLNISSSVNLHSFVFLYSATSFFNCFSLSMHSSRSTFNCSIFFCETAFSLIRALDASSPASVVSFKTFSNFSIFSNLSVSFDSNNSATLFAALDSASYESLSLAEAVFKLTTSFDIFSNFAETVSNASDFVASVFPNLTFSETKSSIFFLDPATFSASSRRARNNSSLFFSSSDCNQLLCSSVKLFSFSARSLALSAVFTFCPKSRSDCSVSDFSLAYASIFRKYVSTSSLFSRISEFFCSNRSRSSRCVTCVCANSAFIFRSSLFHVSFSSTSRFLSVRKRFISRSICVSFSVRSAISSSRSFKSLDFDAISRLRFCCCSSILCSLFALKVSLSLSVFFFPCFCALRLR